ncbi:hypothetical protein MVES_002966 [Malassezia vespertilionis]|uniref:rRNA-processing protein FYV7 n=1 Tax=Malassezia vespertilionis TaxID=2020962 RepID=A0A2N1J8U3_9BASI|nr:hypothetical protein MVES_002966 [Malassezia vespertilionis]
MHLRVLISVEHKADLIHKANVKKAYAKVKKQEGIEEPHTMQETTQDLGRFVPQHETPDSAAPTQAPPPKASAEKPTKKKLPYFYRVPKETEKREPQAPPRTRDEAVEQRRERHALWNKKSPSHLGRQRGQPDLGARMAVMLDKIKHT